MSDTTTDTLTRLALLVPQIETGLTVITRYDCKINTSELPCMMLKAQGATRESISSTSMNVTRNYVLLLFVEGPCDDALELQDTARAACQPYLDLVPSFFAKRPRLENRVSPLDSGLAGIMETSLLSDDGAQLTTWQGDTFAAVLFRLAVTHRINF